MTALLDEHPAEHLAEQADVSPQSSFGGGHMREASRVLGKASVVAGVVVLALPAVAPAGDALRLAQRYAPVVMLKTQKKECGKGEAFRPTSVDVVIDNPDVILRDGYGRVAAKGPTAKTLYGKSPAYHLDLPGDPLHPGCGFERDFRRWSCRAAGGHVRPCRHRARPARGAVLALLHVQQLQRQARERLGVRPGRLRRADGGTGPRRRPGRGRRVTARGRGARRVERRPAPERGHAPGHLPGRRLARELLLRRALARAEREAGFRLRRHGGPVDAHAARRPAAALERLQSRRTERLARLSGPLGSEGGGVQQRPAGPAGAGRVDEADHLAGQAPRRRCGDPGPRHLRAERDELLLRRGRQGLRRVHLHDDEAVGLPRPRPAVACGRDRGIPRRGPHPASGVAQLRPQPAFVRRDRRHLRAGQPRLRRAAVPALPADRPSRSGRCCRSRQPGQRVRRPAGRRAGCADRLGGRWRRGRRCGWRARRRPHGSSVAGVSHARSSASAS